MVFLSRKLECCGIQAQEIVWFRSNLPTRKQFSRVNGVDSSIGDTNVDVPQGSYLGPLHFLVYINNLP